MKKYILIIIGLWIASMFAGCTHNGGPDGPLYGRWHLERIEADNMEALTLTREFYLSFQSNTVMLQRDNGSHHSVTQEYGNFRLDDNTLFIEFHETSNPDSPAYADAGFTNDNILQVLKLTHKDLILMSRPDENKSITWYFRKW